MKPRREAGRRLRTSCGLTSRKKPGVAPPRRPALPKPNASRAAGRAADAAAAKPGKRKFIMIGVLGLLALAAIGYGVYFVLVGRFYVSTDDAYVRANNTTLGARVSGHVAAILPRDNSIVRAGDVIFRIDDGDYRIAVDAARSRIATQQATIDRIGRQVTALESAVEQAKAQLASAEAALKRAGLDFDRQQTLSTKGFASRAAFEVSEASRDQGIAAVKSAQAAYDAARDNVEVTKAQQAEARAQLAELQTQLAKAERDLAFTSVRAPVDGTFSNRLVNTGDFIQAGQRLANVVPLNDVFIDANYKETQLKRIRPGQPVNDLGRRLRPSQVRRRRRQHFAGGGIGVHAAAAGQRHRQFHQDRAAAAGSHSRAEGRREAEPAARRHVGLCRPSIPARARPTPTARPTSMRPGRFNRSNFP